MEREAVAAAAAPLYLLKKKDRKTATVLYSYVRPVRTTVAAERADACT
jgi:hypothetical protein